MSSSSKVMFFPTGGRRAATVRGNPSAGVRATSLVLALLVVFSAACASIRPGDDAVLVRAEDVRVQTRVLYDETMKFHYAHSEKESPAVYLVMEKVRSGFVPIHKTLVGVIDTYSAAKTKDPAALRYSVLKALEGIEGLGDEAWKTKVGFIRAVFSGGAP